MVVAHFIVNGEERETREVPETWLQEAWANRENVLLHDGNPYQIQDVHYTAEGHARVDVVAPRFARGG